MSESPLWLVNTNGNVFTLSTRHRRFRQLVKTYQDGVRLKRVAACQSGAWGIGNDHRIYLFVHASEVPIRVQESTYENQRWSPIGSYSGSHLLRTDRTNWSDEHGSGFLPKEGFTLPLSHWRWEGDWEIDDNFQGEVASRGGWQYAPNFPAKWTAESRWNSLVRKRKWIRFRRFMSTNIWAKLCDDREDDKSEMYFIDIAVGGFDIPNQPKGHLCVWGITFSGQVYVRYGVTHSCPEGTEWGYIPTGGPGLVNITVGPTGLVWGVTWDGQVIVRLGVSRDHVFGTSWTLVTYPESSIRIMQVSLGLNSLWALSREGKVWYRKGIQGTQLLTNVEAATGSNWVEMVGEMSLISVSPTDQVFAIGLNDKEIYFRTGVSNSDLGGKTWQVLALKENNTILQQDSTTSLQSDSYSESDFEDSNRFSERRYFHRTGSAATQSESGASTSSVATATLSIKSGGSSIQEQSVVTMTLATPIAKDTTGGTMTLATAIAKDSTVGTMMLATPIAKDSTGGTMTLATAIAKDTTGGTMTLATSIAKDSTVGTMTLATPIAKDSTGGTMTLATPIAKDSTGGTMTLATPIAKDSTGGTMTLATATIEDSNCDSNSDSVLSVSHDTSSKDGITLTKPVIKEQEDIREGSLPACDLPDTLVDTSQSLNETKENDLSKNEDKALDQSDSVINECMHINDQDDQDDTQITQRSLSISVIDTETTCSVSKQNNDSTSQSETSDTVVTFHCGEDTESKEHQLTPEAKTNEQLSLVISSCDTMDSLGSSITSEVGDNMFNFVTDLLSSSTISKSSKSDDTDASFQDVKASPSNTEQTQTQVLGDGSSEKLPSNEPQSIPWTTMRPSTGVSGTISTASTPSMEQDVYPMFEMTPAMPRYCWAWLSGMACRFEDPAKIPWLQDKEEREDIGQSEGRRRISLHVRDDILRKLQARNTREIENFQFIESAVQRTSWLKKGAMKWWLFGRRAKWVDCSLELEQGHEDHEEGSLTIHYAFKGKQRHCQICIQDIVCVKRLSDYNDKTAFTIHTPETVKSLEPVLLKPTAESDTEDWVSMLYTINAVTWKLSQPIPPGSVWSTTMRGDVFIHPPDKLHVKGHEMCWMQHGGHFHIVETSVCGITWAVGYDHSVWVYSGGFGGGFFKATSPLSKSVNLQTDIRTVSVYENQKWYPVIGFSNKGFLSEGFGWSNGSGQRKDSKEEVQLPSGKWTWMTQWQTNYELEGDVDNEGWQYSSHYEGPFHKHMGLRDSIRRRKWMRKCRLETLGPWESCESVPLRDVSMQTESVEGRDDPVVMWGVGTNGNVLSRLGVTLDNPHGDSWIHVETDQPFQAISVGGSYRVWALARDGSAWYRPGVTQYNITGTCWLQVVPPPPLGCHLKHISVGRTAVWAIDTKGNLWQRQEITETFPEGTRWTIIANTVRSVSVGPEDQVWIVAGSNFLKNRCGPGVIYRRLGISPHCVSGTGWEKVIGNGWEYVSVRGYTEPQEQEAAELPTKEPL